MSKSVNIFDPDTGAPVAGWTDPMRKHFKRELERIRTAYPWMDNPTARNNATQITINHFKRRDGVTDDEANVFGKS